MPSTNRRSLLAALGATGAAGLAGCTALSGGPPDVDPHTGLAGNPRAELAGTPVYVAGDADDLPTPPTTAGSLADAEVALATPSASIERLAAAFRRGTAVAFARGTSAAALRSLLDAVGDDYGYGIETVVGRPTPTAVAVPSGDVAHTFQFVESGWNDDVLDPLGWALGGRLPDCRTFVPERSDRDQYAPIGTAWIAGRLPTGETCAARTRGRRYVGDGDVRALRLRTTIHAAANDGYAVAEARRVADFPNDESLSSWFPNPHTDGGVEVSNGSDPTRERFEVAFTPASDRARGALTGCCGLTADGVVAYDHRTTWEWTRDGLLGSEGRYAGGPGRGEWHVPP